MRTKLKLGLIGLNIALLGVLGVVTLQPSAGADSGLQPIRPRGQYVMVSGRIQGGSSNAVYLLDVVNQELIAIRWDPSGQRLDGIGYRHVASDTAAQGGQR